MNSFLGNFLGKIGEIFGIGGAVITFVLLIFFLFIMGPWLLFWSIEVVAFAAGLTITIPLTFKTWLAAVVFLFLVRGGNGSKE